MSIGFKKKLIANSSWSKLMAQSSKLKAERDDKEYTKIVQYFDMSTLMNEN